MGNDYIGQTLKPGPPGPDLGLAVLYLAHQMFVEPMKRKAFRLPLIIPEAWVHLLPVGHTLFLVPAGPQDHRGWAMIPCVR